MKVSSKTFHGTNLPLAKANHREVENMFFTKQLHLLKMLKRFLLKNVS